MTSSLKNSRAGYFGVLGSTQSPNESRSRVVWGATKVFGCATNDASEDGKAQQVVPDASVSVNLSLTLNLPPPSFLSFSLPLSPTTSLFLSLSLYLCLYLLLSWWCRCKSSSFAKSSSTKPRLKFGPQTKLVSWRTEMQNFIRLKLFWSCFFVKLKRLACSPAQADGQCSVEYRGARVSCIGLVLTELVLSFLYPKKHCSGTIQLGSIVAVMQHKPTSMTKITKWLILALAWTWWFLKL